MFEKALGIDTDGQHPLIYTLETAAFNESFADIFGTAAEFYARERQCIPCPANPGNRSCEQRAGVSCLLGNYLLGEDQKGGTGFNRDMEHPSVSSYNNINYAINSAHAMGSIQSKVFWLLAQSGTNPWNNISVTGIGRAAAEEVFYRALTQHLTYSDSAFASVRKATLATACNPPFGSSSQACSSTAAAWDAVGVPANQIDGSTFFVAQQYADFLNRSPDADGLTFWTNNINNCAPQPSCIEGKRVDTSAAYFLSVEFQQTGYWVERMYKSAYGDTTGTSTYGGSHQLSVPVVRFGDFLYDTQKVGKGVIVGQSGWEGVLETNKHDFADQFVLRSQFTSAFPTSLTPAQFVDTLNTNAGNPLSSSERDGLVNDLTTGAKTRAQVLRAVVEDQDLYNSEFNRAFVLMQYFGYLRRNPDSAPDMDYFGYDFWLQKLIQYNGNYTAAEMVKAFIESVEYRQRFGQG